MIGAPGHVFVQIESPSHTIEKLSATCLSVHTDDEKLFRIIRAKRFVTTLEQVEPQKTN